MLPENRPRFLERSSQNFEARHDILRTFLVTEIADAARMWAQYPTEMSLASSTCDEIVTKIVASNGGVVLKAVEDMLFVAFPTASAALEAAQAIHEGLAKVVWPEQTQLKVRCVIHAGTGSQASDHQIEIVADRVHRILGATAPGNTCLSGESYDLCRDSVPSLACKAIQASRGNGVNPPLDLYVVADGQSDGSSPNQRGPNIKCVGTPIDVGRPFVGRKTELELLSKRLRDPQQRLITILGMGGTGKSRLAYQAAVNAADDFMDGALVVDVPSFSTPEDISAGILSGLGSNRYTSSAINGANRELAARHMLLVLDCMESHLAAAPFLSGLLQAAPNVTAIVTSRIALGISQEYIFELSGMAGDKQRIAEGVSLFCLCAKQRDESSVHLPADRKIVEEICGVLEGMPLAIILAATRLRGCTLFELHDMLRNSRLDTLQSRHDRDGKHSTMRRVIDDSFQLVEERQRAALISLCVLQNGFQREDAAAVLCFGKSQTNETLESLRDFSLLTAVHTGSGMRYRILDSIREYVAELGETDPAIKRRFLDRMLSRAADLKAATSPSRARFYQDASNLRRALETAKELGETEAAASLALHCARPALESRLNSDFLTYCDAGMEHATASGDQSAMLEFLGLLGAYHSATGDRTMAQEVWLKRKQLAEEIADVVVAVDAMLDLSNLLLEDGNFDEAVELVELALVASEGSGVHYLVATCRVQLAKIWESQDETAEVIAELRRAMEVPVPAEEVAHYRYVYRQSAEMLERAGLSAMSEQAFRCLLSIAGHGPAAWTARALSGFGSFLARRGDCEGAANCLSVALRLSANVDERLLSTVKGQIRTFRHKFDHDQVQAALRQSQSASWESLSDQYALTPPVRW